MNGPVVPGRRIATDAMEEGVAIVGKHAADLAEVLVEVPDADMLHHPDRDDAVETSLELAIIDLAEFDAIGNACRRRALARDAQLLG